MSRAAAAASQNGQQRSAHTTVTVTLLPGSTLTASADAVAVRPAGDAHQTRSTPLTGTVRAKATGGFGPRVDSITVPFRGSIALTALARDPLCPTAAPPPSLDLVAPSLMDISITGMAGWGLVIKGAGSQVFGCGPAGPLTGTTRIGLNAQRIDTAAMFRSGRTQPREHKRLKFTGTASGITLPDGATGQLTANIVARVSLGRRR